MSKFSANLSLSCLKTDNELFLLKQLIKGDRTVFWQLWLLYQDYLSRCCLLWMNNNPTDGEDALHQGMLKAYRKLPQYADKIINLKAWLRQLCYHTCLDLHRKHKKEIICEETLFDSMPTNFTPEKAIASETISFIQKAVNDLPCQLQPAFVLRFYEDRPYEEIAQILSISNCNARKRVQLARNKVKQQLENYLCKEM